MQDLYKFYYLGLHYHIKMEPSMPAKLLWETSKVIIKQWCAVFIQQKILLLLLVANVDVPILHKIFNILVF